MDLIISAIAGLCIGSFLNVCIYRIPRHLSVCRPMRSFCPQCKQQLASFDNIPLVSWLLLRGQCRHCRQPIPGQYPLVEILSCLAAAASCLHFGITATGVVVYVLVAALIVVTFIDLEFKIIPNVISFPGMIIGCMLSIAAQYSTLFSWPVTEGALDSLLGMIAGGGFFYVIGMAYLLVSGREGLGGGDIKLMGLTGSVLGVKSVIPIIFAGSLFGAAVGLITIYLRGGGRHTEIPFGPWLSLGAVLYIFLDAPIFRVVY